MKPKLDNCTIWEYNAIYSWEHNLTTGYISYARLNDFVDDAIATCCLYLLSLVDFVNETIATCCFHHLSCRFGASSPSFKMGQQLPILDLGLSRVGLMIRKRFKFWSRSPLCQINLPSKGKLILQHLIPQSTVMKPGTHTWGSTGDQLSNCHLVLVYFIYESLFSVLLSNKDRPL